MAKISSNRSEENNDLTILQDAERNRYKPNMDYQIPISAESQFGLSTIEKDSEYEIKTKDIFTKHQMKKHMRRVSCDVHSSYNGQSSQGHKRVGSTANPTNELIQAFKEDYSVVLDNFSKMMPELEMNSHIMRYLNTHDILNSEFLYYVMLDLKDLEKYLFIKFHQISEKERNYRERIESLFIKRKQMEQENSTLRQRVENLEKIIQDNQLTSNSARDSKTSEYIHLHYQDLLLQLTNYYHEKLSLLSEKISNPEKSSSITAENQDRLTEILERIPVEEIQHAVLKNKNLFLEINSKIDELYSKCQENKSQEPVPIEIGKVVKFPNVLMTEEGNSLQDLNKSDFDFNQFEKLMKQKEHEINVLRKKEETYQKIIYNLSMELNETKKSLSKIPGPL